MELNPQKPKEAAGDTKSNKDKQGRNQMVPAIVKWAEPEEPVQCPKTKCTKEEYHAGKVQAPAQVLDQQPLASFPLQNIVIMLIAWQDAELVLASSQSACLQVDVLVISVSSGFSFW